MFNRIKILFISVSDFIPKGLIIVGVFLFAYNFMQFQYYPKDEEQVSEFAPSASNDMFDNFYYYYSGYYYYNQPNIVGLSIGASMIASGMLFRKRAIKNEK